MEKHSFFIDKNFRHKYSNLAVTKTSNPLPKPTEVLKFAQTERQVSYYNSTMQLKKATEQTTLEQLAQFTKSLNHRYVMNPRKSFAFQDSICAYSHFLTNPNIELNDIIKVINYIYDHYLFRQYPEAMGCIIGQLLIHRLRNPDERERISKRIDMIYELAKRDRGFCDMSKITYLVLMDIWKRWGCERRGIQDYTGWDDSKEKEQRFFRLCESAKENFRGIWIEMQLNQPKYQHQVVQILRRLMDFRNFTPNKKIINFYMFIFFLTFLIDQHKNTQPFSDDFIKTLRQIISKLCYLPLHHLFCYMNPFLILYKIVAKNREIFGQVILKLHLALRAAPQFLRSTIEMESDDLSEFIEMINIDDEYTQYYDRLDQELEHVVQLKKMVQKPTQFFIYGDRTQQKSQKIHSYEHVFKTLNSQPQKPSDSEANICRSILRAKPQILSYTQQKLAKFQYLELYLTLNRVHKAFMARLEKICQLQTDIEKRHSHAKYLYTWFCAAYLKIMKNIVSEENVLLQEGFMGRSFIQQMHSELIMRMAELGILEMDWKKVYDTIFEEYSIDDTIVLEFTDSGFGVRALFDVIERMDYNVGNPSSYYDLLKLRSYFNTFVTKPNNGPQKDPIRQKLRRQMRRTVQRILRKKQQMINRPQKKFIKTSDYNERQKNKPQKPSDAFKSESQLKYPQNFDSRHHLIKTTIFMIVTKMRQLNQRVPQDYSQIFLCIVTVLDSEKLLLDIYGNLWYRVLGSGNRQLMEWGYDRLNVLRQCLIDERREELQSTKYTAEGMLCVYERLRKIEIVTERWKNKKSSSMVSVDKSSGKSKIYLSDDQQPHEQSKIYQTYFQKLFQSPLQVILDYGKQLASMSKYRQAIYILEQVNDRLRVINNKFQLGIFDQSINSKQFKCKKIQCDIALCNCYAVLVVSFKDVLGRTRKICVEDKLEELRKEYDNQTFEHIMQQIEAKKPPKVLTPTLVTKVTQMIKQQYYKNHRYFNLQQLVLNRDHTRLLQQDFYMQFRVFCQITNYSMCQLASIKTRDDFKTYYRNFLLAALLLKWYQDEKKGELVRRKTKSLSQKDRSVSGEYQFTSQQLQYMMQIHQAPVTQKRKSTYELMPEGESVHQSYSDLIKELMVSMPSANDRLTIAETFYYIEELDGLKRISTMRMHNQALLDAGQIKRLLNMCQLSYGGEKYQLMTLLELETLQRYYFQQGSYQHVKAIAKSMLQQRQHQLYTDKFSSFVCWPQVFYYDLHAKIYDDNLSSDTTVCRRWEEFLILIRNDSAIVVDDLKLSFDLLSDPNYVREFKLKQPIRFGKVKQILSEKICQYLKLLRIIFDNLQLKSKTAISIFLVLQKLYKKFFIPQLTPPNLYIDFFFYYLRFFCEGIHCEWLEIQQESRFTKVIQRASGEIRHIDSAYLYGMDQKSMMEKTENIVSLMMNNLDWIKSHFNYLTKALDQNKSSKKNYIIKKLLVEIICKNPPQHVWILTFIKYYSLKFPSQHMPQRQSLPRKHKFAQRSNFYYSSDSFINSRHDVIIKEVYDEIVVKIGENKINSLLEVPEFLLEILEQNACEKLMRFGRSTYEHQDKMKAKVKELNTRIKQSPWRIPYPLDPNFYIKSLNKFTIIGTGKSVPTMFDFYCRPYSQAQGDIYRNEKNVKMLVDDSLKSFLMKYNFSKEDFTVETATANFYNEFGMLDPQITYKIINLTKYILMIQKIGAKHCTLFELIDQACGIKTIDKEAWQNAELNDTRCPNKGRIDQTRQFYDLTRVQKFNKLDENKNTLSLFKSFYKEGLKSRKNIEEWWKYTDNFIRTLGQWSYLSYLTKLGDRHNQNILVTETGKLIHIDYQFNFSHGLSLPYPEWVPIRLTEALVSVMGTFREKGTFFAYFYEMAKKFDPLDEKTWKALGNFTAEQRGIIVSSANFSRLKKGLSVEEAIERIMDTSRSDSLLRLMFKGWLPIV